ncbi:hypothetical protein Taro_034694 [Colocasia esculenta]|uniref:Rx N-terminal domain-containing protein n=1 Tax=Colocasia esculenta TaxID=4460 RepID=A0A843W1L0_COLES|nr:hypothetical protein [Colocasia esculenta]
MPIGEAFLSASLQVLFDKLASPLISELGKLQGVKYEIARLKRTLKRLKAMLHDAEQKVVEGVHFTLWLRELQTAAHAAEDVVDEFEYEALRRELNCRREGRHGVCGNYPIFSTSGRLGKLCSCLNPQTVSFRYKIAHQIDGIRRKLDEIAKEKRDLDVNVGFPREIQQSIETTALSADPQVLGREEVKNKLVKLLLRTAADVGYTSSLIQIVNGRYVIHDLLHDLGQSMLEHEYCRIGLAQVMKIPEDARSKIHLIVDDPKPPHETKMEVLYEFKSLRTLSFWFTGVPHIKVPIDLFYAVKCLRVLDLSYTSLGMLPNSIGCLKHLRYIDLRETDIECLPDSFCALYNLQTLKLEGCDKLNTLPKGMSNLVNLHYLEAKSEVVSKIAEIGRLRHLQYLEVFSISDENKNRIGDLKNMKELRGTLCIQNLERVVTREEAAEASLKNMQYLESLELQWADGQRITQERNDLADSIIEGLQPPQSLKKLTIKYYPGISFPSWSNINVSIPSFESQLPILSSLRTLNITGCWHLKELSHLPSALENLILQEVGLVVLPSSLHHLPLQQLVLRLALDLHELPLLPSTLRELAIEAVGLQSLPKFCRGCEISSAPSGSDTDAYKSSDCTEPALSILKIHACPHLTTLDDGMLKHHLKHLKVLSIKDCWYLEDWPEGGGFQSTFCSLDEELSIEWCPKLKGLPEGTKLHPSLKKLVVKGCPWVPDELMFSQVHNFDDVSVEKRYLNLEHSANGALRHILTVDLLAIVYLQEEEEEEEDDDERSFW